MFFEPDHHFRSQVRHRGSPLTTLELVALIILGAVVLVHGCSDGSDLQSHTHHQQDRERHENRQSATAAHEVVTRSLELLVRREDRNFDSAAGARGCLIAHLGSAFTAG